MRYSKEKRQQDLINYYYYYLNFQGDRRSESAILWMETQNALLCGWVGWWVVIFPPYNFLHFRMCLQAGCVDSKYGIETCLRLIHQKL